MLYGNAGNSNTTVLAVTIPADIVRPGWLWQYPLTLSGQAGCDNTRWRCQARLAVTIPADVGRVYSNTSLPVVHCDPARPAVRPSSFSKLSTWVLSSLSIRIVWANSDNIWPLRLYHWNRWRPPETEVKSYNLKYNFTTFFLCQEYSVVQSATKLAPVVYNRPQNGG